MNQPSKSQPYSEHFDTLVALVTHLSNTQYTSRTPQGLAQALGLKKDKVQIVLELFPGFFRKSRNTHVSGEHYYTVHLRHAKRSRDRNKEVDAMPLKPEETQALLTLVSNMVTQESETARLYFKQESEYRNLRRTLWITVLLGIISSIAAVTAAIIAARQ